ncbi:glycosyltransferase involved in cell wall biosynthesis [Caballeronia udeis]|uniref:Glycosyltransferase involved in cell wall biosynthesis n=1 Tax=Caballeronia udeis TaxID=1232866 RepID=A0ABW8MF92_9BURK
MKTHSAVATNEHRVLYSGFRWDHHDEVSGYHHVVASSTDYVDGGALWGGHSPIGSRSRRVNFLLIDVLTIVRSLRYRSVLLFYPEQTGYFSAPILRMLGKQVIYVVHLGEDYWLERDDSLFLKLKRFNLRFVSKFITLTQQQKAVFDDHFPGKVVRIPHGTWCRVRNNTGPSASDGKLHLTVVGDTYRDYALLARIIEFFLHHNPRVVFDLVGMKYEKLGESQRAANVVCHGRLNSRQYQEIIENSLFLLLPLKFATANNALLEGLVAGVPVICSNTHGVREYLPPGDYVFDSIEDLALKVQHRSEMTQTERTAEGDRLSSFVKENYSWDVIRNKVIDYCLV